MSDFRVQFNDAYTWFRYYRASMSSEAAYYAAVQTVESHPDVDLALYKAAGGWANERALRHGRLNRAIQCRQRGDLEGARHFLRLLRA